MPRLDEASTFPSLLCRLTDHDREWDAGTEERWTEEPARHLAAEIGMLLGLPAFLSPDRAAGPVSRDSALFRTLPFPITPGPQDSTGLEAFRRQVQALLRGAEPRLTNLSVASYQHDGEGGLMIEGYGGTLSRPVAMRLVLWPLNGPLRVEPMDREGLA